MQLFDTHAHIGLINEDPIEQLIIVQEAKQSGVKHIVSICNNLHDFFQVYQNLSSAPHVLHSIGVSPSEVQNPGKDWELKIEEGTKLDRVVAIGEIGLDYYRKFGDRDSQIELFVRQLELAARLDFPVIIHNREAGADVFDILSEKLPPKGGILHCYSENWEYAKKALDLNLFISFAGNVTYRNARNLQETAKHMPIDRMLIESESPFMIPAFYRGKRNKPSYLHATAEFLAELRGLSLEELNEQLYRNSLTVFGLSE
ncbi:TatD family hydrolase [Sediminispirochaeta smaragdinae]|uniref:Hydrolase, TatD family n=1 Tax=Sediminispirochaeta smaragdinae (strain DSM 11293 / JCM 15392 / SEBR 4228) TaxID=573413 RepID=E1R5G1_SEDSS|nr:TatD family hydrolase [Sediminispirochaeta smaragdinae]ADK82289.1 hydrolase, TatD family [Sediminispirochaeta smaragdinae DSM 11293]